MDSQDPKNSVRNEQFSEKSENKKSDPGSEFENGSQNKEENGALEEKKVQDSAGSEPEVKGKEEQKSENRLKNIAGKEEKKASGEAGEATAEEKGTGLKEDENETSLASGKDGETGEAVPDKETDGQPESEKEPDRKTEPEKEKIQYSLLSKKDLVKVLDDLLSETGRSDKGREVEEIKSAFYKKHKEELSALRKKFVEDGGQESDFTPPFNEEEAEMKDLLKRYREQKHQQIKVLEEEKELNLKKKYEIIKEIEELIHKDESINRTFQDFRDLQNRWHEIGVVPQKDLKALWENYHYNVEKFYDFIKINKELRDLDLKKNHEAKIDLCEKAESLLLETNLVQAFKTLQKYHEQWREIGPVPKEQRAEIWERFKEATSKINKKHQQFYQDLKEQQKKNLESKTILCEKAEELITEEINDHSSWVKKTHEILELQKVWKTIGFAPKKDNNSIYARFRAACDKFFERKRSFYAQNLEDQGDNLKEKIKLCEQAESIKDSTDWRKTSDELISMQKKWKTIGPVPRKQSDEVWKRFRAACDHFFNRRSDFFANMDSVYNENLKAKEALIEEIVKFKPGDDQKKNIHILNEYQKKWAGIGFVPISKKDEISQKYRDAIDAAFDSLEMDDHKKNMLKFRTRVEGILRKPRSEVKLRFEREKLMNKLQQLKNDIGVWENNIGFFASTKKADSMISEFENKIKSAHEKIKLLEDKISYIDEVAPDL